MKNVIKNVNELSNYALEQLPQVIMVINKDLRLEWYNHELERWLKQPPEIGSFITDIWPTFLSIIFGTVMVNISFLKIINSTW